jgi:GNAT superfamily N-acetyltransferase
MSVVDELVEKFKLKLAIQEATNGRYGGDGESVLSDVSQTTDLELVGYMAFSIANHKQPPAIWIDDLFVRPDFQSRGIATTFFEKIVNDTHSNNYNNIHLIVRTESEQQQNARTLYQKLSFTNVTDESKQQYQPEKDQTYMTANRRQLLNDITNMKKNHDDVEGDIKFFFVRSLDDIKLLTSRRNTVYNKLQELYELFHHTEQGDQAHWDGTNCAIASDSMLILAFHLERNASTTRSGLPIVRLNLSKEHMLATYKSSSYKKTQAHTHSLPSASVNK